MPAEQCLDQLLLKNIETCLDVGAGKMLHTARMRECGIKVTTVDWGNPDADYQGDFLTWESTKKYDAVWMSHVLEHTPNPGHFLNKARTYLKEGGWLAVTVPPRKDNLVGGHLTLWTPALLVYNCILAGFDCAEAKVNHYGYNISLLVKYKPVNLLDIKLKYDRGDIETLSEYFPFPVKQNCNPWVNTGW